ncbi:MAG: excinuclease ABC subunit UvrA [Bacteroidales bacterium]|nr:excinuclease ABC subunit UvrA [Bacteroidales bacterium]
MSPKDNGAVSEMQKKIVIKGAKLNNLKNIDVEIPHHQLVVITGLSGSGKSSLAFDTLYAEGQRRYIESLSSYARQFLGKLNKPEVEYIHGIAPAIAIEQKVNVRNPRSTVGTTTEIYEYLKLLFARIGKTYSPISGRLVKRETVKDVNDYIFSLDEGTRMLLLAPINWHGRSPEDYFKILLQEGFSRVLIDGEQVRIDTPQDFSYISEKNRVEIVVDRFSLQKSREMLNRLGDSIQIAFYEGNGICFVEYEKEGEKIRKEFSNSFSVDGISFEEPTNNLFSFNNPYGACPTCGGYGSIIGIDEDLVIPNKSLSVYEGAVAPWKGEKLGLWRDTFIHKSHHFNFPIHKPYYELSEEQKQILWNGNEYVEGIKQFFKMVEENSYKVQYRVVQSRYRGKTVCPDCHGTRLRKEANYVKINSYTISDLVKLPIERLYTLIDTLVTDPHDLEIATRLLIEIRHRLDFMLDVGLGYLTLNRLSNSLSGGESQRINLATSLGSSLVGSLYILDEPSVGLHPRDTHRLIKVLKKLRDIGNTVIVVEHDEDIIRAADQVIDLGPLAGYLGGELIFSGDVLHLLQNEKSLTAQYLNHKMNIPIPSFRRKWKEFITVVGAAENNLKHIDVIFPLNTLTAVSGVSGSGKTTLVKQILYNALRKQYGGCEERTGEHHCITGSIKQIQQIELIDQNPIGKSSRSNPATYIGAYDDIRSLYASQPLSKTRGYKAGFFSFNVPGGRCEECEGEGKIKVEMQFMADVWLTCQECHGKRFKQEALEVKYRDKDIADILNMTIDEAVDFFKQATNPTTTEKNIIDKLLPLQATGLGYLKLGQSTNTLSGGEAQRVKLSLFLSKGSNTTPTLFIFDEPTTGLHFHDISKLLQSLNALIDKGHSVIVIEHNLDVLKAADWIIDLGPEGGEAGGNLVFAGTPEDLIQCPESYTGQFLKEKFMD